MTEYLEKLVIVSIHENHGQKNINLQDKYIEMISGNQGKSSMDDVENKSKIDILKSNVFVLLAEIAIALGISYFGLLISHHAENISIGKPSIKSDHEIKRY